jgi:hypothetical protein
MLHTAGDGLGSRSIYFNGKKINKVKAADDLNGWIEVFVTDGQGNYVVEGDSIKTIKKYGDVEVVFTNLTEE